MRKKLILFDWGNIVESHTTGYSCLKAWDDVFYACGFDGDDSPGILLKKYKSSCIRNTSEFKKTYSKIKKEFHLNKTYDEFVNIYYKTFENVEYYKEVADYEKSLKDRCYIGIYSNLTIFDKVRLDKEVDLSQYDYVFLSFEYGLRKPDIKLYEKVQEKLPFKKEDILFIDDRSDNVKTAIEFGWNAFQSTGLELDKIKEKCEEFINK